MCQDGSKQQEHPMKIANLTAKQGLAKCLTVVPLQPIFKSPVLVCPWADCP
jgi:hypothetical protein